MKPFKMFFVLAVGIILLSFIVRVAFIAFIMAAVMSILYAVFRRIRDFITYDRYGKPYFQQYETRYGLSNDWNNEAEPLFYDGFSRQYAPTENIRYIETR